MCSKFVKVRTSILCKLGCVIVYKILKRLSTVLVILVICCIGYLLFISHQAQENLNEIPSFLGYKPLTVLTNSMQPKISAGDMVFVKTKKATEVKVGEIITFKVTDTNTKLI